MIIDFGIPGFNFIGNTTPHKYQGKPVYNYHFMQRVNPLIAQNVF